MVSYDKYAYYEINMQYDEPNTDFNHHWLEPVSEPVTHLDIEAMK